MPLERWHIRLPLAAPVAEQTVSAAAATATATTSAGLAQRRRQQLRCRWHAPSNFQHALRSTKAQEPTFGKSKIIYLDDKESDEDDKKSDDKDSQEDDGLKIDKSERTFYFRRPSQGECWRKQKFKFRLIDVP